MMVRIIPIVVQLFFALCLLQLTGALADEVVNQQPKGAAKELRAEPLNTDGISDIAGGADGLTRFESHRPVETASLPDDPEFKYVGNCFSKKFHRPWCPFEQVMSANKAVFFRYRWHAIEAGFKPCRYCLPAVVKQVRCVLLNRDLSPNQRQERQDLKP